MNTDVLTECIKPPVSEGPNFSQYFMCFCRKCVKGSGYINHCKRPLEESMWNVEMYVS